MPAFFIPPELAASRNERGVRIVPTEVRQGGEERGGTKKHELNNKTLKKWIFRQIKRSKSIGS